MVVFGGYFDMKTGVKLEEEIENKTNAELQQWCMEKSHDFETTRKALAQFKTGRKVFAKLAAAKAAREVAEPRGREVEGVSAREVAEVVVLEVVVVSGPVVEAVLGQAVEVVPTVAIFWMMLILQFCETTLTMRP